MHHKHMFLFGAKEVKKDSASSRLGALDRVPPFSLLTVT